MSDLRLPARHRPRAERRRPRARRGRAPAAAVQLARRRGRRPRARARPRPHARAAGGGAPVPADRARPGGDAGGPDPRRAQRRVRPPLPRGRGGAGGAQAPRRAAAVHLALSRRLGLVVPDHKLATLAGYWGVPQKRAHHAVDDVEVLARVLTHSLLLAARLDLPLPIVGCAARPTPIPVARSRRPRGARGATRAGSCPGSRWCRGCGCGHGGGERAARTDRRAAGRGRARRLSAR